MLVIGLDRNDKKVWKFNIMWYNIERKRGGFVKIINKENNEEVAYVQKGDLGFMMHSCDGVPAAFLDEFFNNIVIINGDNRREFVRFNNPKIVKWLKDQDWIIDYRNYVKLSEDSIMKKVEGLVLI